MQRAVAPFGAFAWRGWDLWDFSRRLLCACVESGTPKTRPSSDFPAFRFPCFFDALDFDSALGRGFAVAGRDGCADVAGFGLTDAAVATPPWNQHAVMPL